MVRTAMARTAMAIERERVRGCTEHLRCREPVTRGRRASLLLVRERGLRLLVHEGFRDKVTATKAKARLELPVSQAR